jgi:hypothetical protein
MAWSPVSHQPQARTVAAHILHTRRSIGRAGRLLLLLLLLVGVGVGVGLDPRALAVAHLASSTAK